MRGPRQGVSRSRRRARPVAMLVRYTPRKGCERRLLALVSRHWPALRAAGLATAVPARVFKARDKRDGRLHFVEMFEWRDAGASATAHETPAVRAVWEPMEPLLEDMQLCRIEAVAAGRRRVRPGIGRPR